MSTFRFRYWLVVPLSDSANQRLAPHFTKFADDRSEENVRCENGAGTVIQNGWRAEDFSGDLKPVLKSFTSAEIKVYRCSVGKDAGVPWRAGILKHLPRRARYARPRRHPKT